MQRYKTTGDKPIMDAAKLYYSFETGEGNGLLGVFVTIFLYIFTCFAAGAILYMYFLRYVTFSKFDLDSFFVLTSLSTARVIL